ncbi:formimidoylglutamate deiminase [Salinifilum ghardaiensis]
MTTYWCEHAWLPGGPASAVRLDVSEGVLTRVETGAPRSGTQLPGMVLPGFANTHSHAFHRALRGRTHHDRGTFWTWRERMYELAARLDPDSYYRLARAAYAEMVLAGYTGVAEFHYLHHAPGGSAYADPNAMGAALAAAARDAGIRLTLLDTCYLRGGFDADLAPHQRRFGDGSAEAWADRVDRFRPGGDVVLGAAVHSVRAVGPADLGVVTERSGDRPLHVHVSEQRAENEDCLRHHGATPTQVLAEAGVLGPRTTAVHATHLTGADVSALADSGTTVSLCPTTERDLGDGIGPARDLADAGVRLGVGSDSNAVVDAFEEVRAVELDERLRSERRGCFTAEELVAAGTAHHALGRGDVGAIAEGARADLLVVDLETERTAGAEPSGALFAATAADVRSVLVDGRWVVRDGVHQHVPDAAGLLGKEVALLCQ